MTATSADVARFTNDGTLITLTNQPLKTADPNARDMADRELQMHFDEVAPGQQILDELFAFVGAAHRPHEGVQFDDTVGLGTTVPLWPAAPAAYVVDEERRLSARTIISGFSFDMGSDSYAVELIGAPPEAPDGTPVTMDSTVVTMDDTTHTLDEA